MRGDQFAGKIDLGPNSSHAMDLNMENLDKCCRDKEYMGVEQVGELVISSK